MNRQTRRWCFGASAAFFLYLVACGSGGSSKAAPPEDAAPIQMDAGLRIPRTTPPAQAIRELQGRIKQNLAREAAGTSNLERRGTLVGLLMTRAQFLGHPRDYSTALQLAEKMVDTHPRSGQAYLWRARARAALHLFTDAESDLQRAQHLGVGADQIEKARAGALLATGRITEAALMRQKWLNVFPNIATRGDAALALAKMGEIDRASALFDEAVSKYRNVSAFAVSWVLFQHGLMWQRQGKLAKARDYYELGRARLPRYAPLTAHLAGVEAATGNRKRAIELLSELVKVSTDPEYPGQLGALLAEAGRPDEAGPMVEKARAGYETLVAAYPAAFADHAARFWLGPGGDAQKAVALANANLQHRVTDESLQLALDATHAAKTAPKDQCALADRARKRTRASAYLLFAAARALRGCQRDADADAALRRAEKTTRQR